MPKIYCKYDELVDPNKLNNHPKNRNKHGQDQVERLAKLYAFHGIRHPIIVSKETGYIVAGHGRKLASLRAGIERVPVVYQSFENEESEYAFIQADNAIALWSHLDLAEINKDLADLGPDFDIDLLGIKSFTIEPFDKFDPEDEWSGMPEFDQGDKTSFRHVVVHFKSQEDAEEFFKAIDQKATDKTRSIWFPEQENMNTESKRYG